jgi:hypothetical protein
MPDQNEFPTLPDADTTIHIDAQSDIFKVLLDLVTDAATTTEATWTFHEMTQALDLGERLGFTHLPRRALPFMHSYAKSYSWAVFTFAAKNDFPTLAAYAIDKLRFAYNFSSTGFLDFDYAMLDGIPGKYVGPLVRNMTLFRNEGGDPDWRKVSHNFPKLEKVGLHCLVTTDSRTSLEPRSHLSSNSVSVAARGRVPGDSRAAALMRTYIRRISRSSASSYENNVV